MSTWWRLVTLAPTLLHGLAGCAQDDASDSGETTKQTKNPFVGAWTCQYGVNDSTIADHTTPMTISEVGENTLGAKFGIGGFACDMTLTTMEGTATAVDGWLCPVTDPKLTTSIELSASTLVLEESTLTWQAAGIAHGINVDSNGTQTPLDIP
ncbi:MAG TPA: hypothetical protein VMS65_03305, partial [Polyangiaceae bacterium]|nr:hypothetical protein [Polyangiaceae bacterium]